MTRARPLPLLALLACLSLSGCLEERVEVSLQANGSGKLRFEQVLGPRLSKQLLELAKLEAKLSEGFAEELGDDDILNTTDQFAADALLAWSGVSAWTDVAVETKAGKIHLRATGWFDDLSAVRRSAEGGFGLGFRLTKPAGGAGELVVEARHLVDPEEVEDAEEAAAMWLMTRKMVKGFRHELTLALPGEVTAHSADLVPTKDAPGRLTRTLGDAEIVRHTDRAVALARDVARRIDAGELEEAAGVQALEDGVNETPTRGVCQVRAPPAADTFAAELAAAKQGWGESPWKRKLALALEVAEEEAAEDEAYDEEAEPRLVPYAPPAVVREALTLRLQPGGAARASLSVDLSRAQLPRDLAQLLAREAPRIDAFAVDWLNDAWPNAAWGSWTVKVSDEQVALTAEGYFPSGEAQPRQVPRDAFLDDHALVIRRDFDPVGRKGVLTIQGTAREGGPALQVTVIAPGAAAVVLTPGVGQPQPPVVWEAESGVAPMSPEFAGALGKTQIEWSKRVMARAMEKLGDASRRLRELSEPRGD
jgi:hypothetical protein